MRKLVNRLKKLEKHKNPDNNLREELDKYFEEENVHFVERLGILASLGLLDGLEIAQLIKQGS